VSVSKLGRGFESLIPKNFDTAILSSEDKRIQNIPVTQLQANPEQPRVHFDEENLHDLAQSIKQHGIIQPIVITPNGDKFYIIAGERRWRAAKIAGLQSVPAIVRSSEQLERLEIALVENVQRVNLSPLEQAASIEFLHQQFSLDYATIGIKLGKASATVQNCARLLQLPDEVQQALRDEKISEGHARAILGIKSDSDKIELLKLILQKKWSVRETERYVVAHKKGAKTSTVAEKKVAVTSPQTERLTKFLRTPVTLRRTAKGGKLEIRFTSEAELKRIIATISK
jgi:ParB family chromosome partitioning protein